MTHVKTSAGKNKYRWDYKEFCYLVSGFSKAKNFKEVINLFIDLHTHQEISEIIRRFIIASMLNNGLTYEKITEKTGASAATISKIQHKFYREKTMLPEILKRTGSFEGFMRVTVDDRDSLQKMFDRAIYKRSLGLLGNK